MTSWFLLSGFTPSQEVQGGPHNLTSSLPFLDQLNGKSSKDLKEDGATDGRSWGLLSGYVKQRAADLHEAVTDMK